MSTEMMNDRAQSKSPQPLSKPPSIPPPPVPNPSKTTLPLPHSNGSPFKNVSPIKTHHYSSKSQPISPSSSHTKHNNGIVSPQTPLHPLQKPIETVIPKWHRFGTLLLGSHGTKHNDIDTTPTLHAANTAKSIHKPILNTQQRDILANIIITILSSVKSKKLPNILSSGSRKSSCDVLYSSESDQASEDNHNNNDIRDSDDTEHNETMEEMEEDLTHSSPEPDFVDRSASAKEIMKDNKDSSTDSKDDTDTIQSILNTQETDKQTLAKVVVSQKEKLILMSSISKYIDSQNEMDTIHRACFNLWKDWYRCYGTITNQFQAAFMKVCEKLLGNVDSRALAREPPLTAVNNKNISIEEITYHLSTQISTLKHAFAVEQLNTTPTKNGCNDAQNVPQIIDGMEPNVWLIVKHIICEYIKSSYWVQCRYTLFNLFLNQYESVNRKLDREFISTSSFGVYTLLCQLCSVVEHAFSDNKSDDDAIIDDGFNLDRSMSGPVTNKEKLIMIREEDNDDNGSSSSDNGNIELKDPFCNDELLSTLDWYYSICRLETLLSNKRKDYLTLNMYRLYKPMFDPVFRYFDDNNNNDNDGILSLIQSFVDETDYITLKTRYDLILREIRDEKKGILIRPSTPDKKKEMNFVLLLSRIIDSSLNWICKDLYYNYRTSEFCMLLTQLLADPASFKVKKEQSRSVRIIKLHERFNLPSDQALVNSFSCAIDTGKFLHQGKIYFFKDYLCFYANMLGIKDTQQKFLLPVTEIKTVARKVTAWVFNNAIEIQMKDGRTFTFRTFMKRDVTFELLQKLINGEIDWDEVEKKQKRELQKEKEENIKEIIKIKEKEEEKEEHEEKSVSNLKKKSVMNEISGFVMSAIDVSSSKLLSTDAKLLLQSNKRKKQKNGLPEVLEMKNMTKENEVIYNTSANNEEIPIPMALIATRSAPTSPIHKKIELQDIKKKPSSDSETAEHRTDIEMVQDDEESSIYSSIHQNGIISEPEDMMDDIKRSIDVITDCGEDSMDEDQMKEECERLNSMHCKWILSSKPKVEKDFEVMVEYEFGGIGVDEFWDKFWSSNAIFSVVDWTKADPMNSNIESDEWSLDPAPHNNDEEWYHRTISCVTKLEDLPTFFPKSISQCTSETLIRYCKLDKYFYVVHKNMCVNDIPFADCYNTHQKIELKQSATIVYDIHDKASISLSTHIIIYFGVEWKKSTWLKSPVRSRTLLSVKQDNLKYCEEVNKRILALSQSQEEEEEEVITVNKKQEIVKKKKRRKVKKKAMAASLLVDEKKVLVDTQDDYDFVLKIGNDNSLIRCRLLLACCTKSSLYASSTWIIVLAVILSIFIILCSLYTVGCIMALLSSVMTVVTSSAQYINQISSQLNNVNPLQHLNQVNIKHCHELTDLMSINPESDILHKTYDSLNCVMIDDNL